MSAADNVASLPRPAPKRPRTQAVRFTETDDDVSVLRLLQATAAVTCDLERRLAEGGAELDDGGLGLSTAAAILAQMLSSRYESTA